MDKKILIADDDEETLGALSRMLAGYDVVSAGDGKAALELTVSEKPDILLLDVDMPGLNGLEVLGKVMAMSRKPLVIMITGDASTETVSKALAIGVFSYIIKPFEKDEVLDQVKRAFAFREASAST
jgi:DNA-binding NtrC family response regulator